MGRRILTLHILLVALAWSSAFLANAEDPYRFYTWEVTYGKVSPLGEDKQGILINGQFPGPPIEAVTNDNIIINLINNLDEPFLITWNGIQQRKNSWQDGVFGTQCPIPPGTNWTYKFQLKDQIGTFMYFPSIDLQRTAGGFGALNVAQRIVIPIPYPAPYGEFTLLVGDWYKKDHKALRQSLDDGNLLPLPDAILINGRPNGFTFAGEPGETYKFRVTNVGIATSINFRIQGHTLALVEVEGSHTLQEAYESLDVHVGQSVAVLVTLHASPKDYYVVASTRFTKPILTATAILHYDQSNTPPSGPLPIGPTYQIHWSIKQARTIRLNLTANAARPNPQGSYHYGTIPVTRTVVLANRLAPKIDGKLNRYTTNGVSYVDPDTPLKLADYFNIPGVFNLNGIPSQPPPPPYSFSFGTPVLDNQLHDFLEIVFQNDETTIQSWHLDGYCFYVVAYGPGQWTPDMRKRYNMADAIYRHTVQVYPSSWSAILVSLDNKGMWNLRSAIWQRRFLGQQTYLRVWNNEKSLLTEFDIPPNALLCGRAKH